MTKHTPTLWEWDAGDAGNETRALYCDVYVDGGNIIIAQVNRYIPEGFANADRIVACVNAFHSPDGREIKTEKIEEGLFWEMRDLLESVPKALASAESAGEFEGSASVQYEDGLAPNRQAEKARRYSVDFAEKARALLAKLEE